LYRDSKKGVKFVRPGDAGSIGRLLEVMRGAQPTYADTGGTLKGHQPVGFRYDRYERVIGHGVETFEHAVSGLQGWHAHSGPGVKVFPEGAKIRAGATVIVTLGRPFMAIAAPCRIVEVVDEPDRWGFAYGTLPGHPEQGEEAFVVSMSPDTTVRFEVIAFSRPGEVLVRLSGPVGRYIQRMGTKGYLDGLQRFVDHAK
jgi:uncharacterized protein (UPF0548 family)